MWKLALMVSLLASFACTTPNPKACGDGNCTDPSFPFCDVNGSLGGAPGECVAVTCTAGEVAECRGDVEVRCNADGTNFELVQCERGCEPDTGCRLCDPNETACTNGAVATCDANGTVVSSQECALGCFEAEPRCRDIEPSNGLGIYLDMVDDPPDLDLSMGGTIDTSTGIVTSSGGVVLTVPTFVVSGDAPIRVLVVASARLIDVDVHSDQAHGGNALAILATDEIVVDGVVEVTSGDRATGTCVGGAANEINTTNPVKFHRSSGSGGGGHATAGGLGGDVDDGFLVGGQGGQPSGSDTLEPLRGGCASGGIISDTDPLLQVGARGGGAIQLTSSRAIVIKGRIDASGRPGTSVQDRAFVGGGAGGAVLLEAPELRLEEGAVLDASGGNGRGCDPPTPLCGLSGQGAHFDSAATDGGPVGSVTPVAAGGGGGGLGRIRVNTSDSTYTKSSNVIEDGSITVGTIKTR